MFRYEIPLRDTGTGTRYSTRYKYRCRYGVPGYRYRCRHKVIIIIIIIINMLMPAYQ